MKENKKESAKAFRISSKNNGFHPIPVQTAIVGNRDTGKRPLLDDWKELAPTLTIDDFQKVEEAALNTGIALHDLYAIDQDSDDEQTSADVEKLIIRHFGSIPLKRFRQRSFRFLALFRSEGGIKKQRVGKPKSDRYLEVLSDGQQFVADGTHYSGAALEWIDGRSPANFPKDQLPLITQAQMKAFLIDVKTLFGTDSYTIHDYEDYQTSAFIASGNATAENLSEEDLYSLVEALPADSGYEEWMQTIGILHRATSGSAFGNQLAHSYSQKSSVYDRKAVEQKWQHFSRNPLTKSTIGTLIKRVRDINPDWLSPTYQKVKDARSTPLPKWAERKAQKELAGIIVRPTDAPVYEWVSDNADKREISVNAGGRISDDKVNFKNDLILLNSLRDKSERFSPLLIETALDKMIYERRKEAEEALRARIDTSLSASTLDATLDRLADLMRLGIRAGGSVSPHLAARVMAKTIWQVKRKLHNKPVTRHLMVVFVGGEGSGKTWMVERFTSPMAEMRIPLDFSQLTDERSIDIFSGAVGVMDEMAKAGKADVEVLKNIITADTISRRPMRSNSSTDVKQRLTFVGTANKGIDEMVIDETSNRRFFQIDMLNKTDARREDFWKAVNEFDWLDLWRVVDEDGADPTAYVLDEIVALQHEQRNVSRIEQWLSDEKNSLIKLFDDENEDVLSASELFASFDVWSHATNTFKVSSVTFAKELRREVQTSDLLLVAKKTKHKNGYVLR